MKRKEKVAYLKVENNFHVELLRPHIEKAKKKKKKQNKKVEVKGRKRQTQNQNQMNTRSGTQKLLAGQNSQATSQLCKSYSKVKTQKPSQTTSHLWNQEKKKGV